MSQTVIPVVNPSGIRARLWQVGQVLVLAITGVLLWGLLARPEPALGLLWNVLIPVLPAVFLLHPTIWRNVCPLATVNLLSGHRRGHRTLAGPESKVAGTLGIVLLAGLVPARHFLFNHNGAALAITILIVVALALILGSLFTAKAGFCNAVCPVLPVERLYGQRPMVEVANARCAPCTLCTQRGCMDLAPTKSIPQILGAARRGSRWWLTPFGLFAAAFPGFIVGYFTVEEAQQSAALSVYLHVLGWAAVSMLVVVAVTYLRRGRNERLVLGLAAVSAALYYWFAAPGVVDQLSLSQAGTISLRVTALAFIAVWWWQALRNGRNGS